MAATRLIDVDRPGPELEEVRALLGEYWRSFGFTPCFQDFDRELATLPGAYAPPRGALLLAPGAGCVALRPLDARTVEMKRLYVRPQARRAGLGRTLAEAAVARARALGFSRLEEPHVNPAPQHREVWLRDPDGYLVVLASTDGSAW